MASLSSVIEIIFNATNNASREIDRLVGDLGKLDDNVQAIAAPFADLANGLLKAEAAALAFGAAVAVLAVRETVKFQDALYLVQKQLGDSSVSMDQARQDIEALGLTYGINANEVAQSVAGFLAAGNDYQTAAKLVETSTQLMIAGELEASFAVDAINKSLAGFRIPAEDAAESATKIGDILNKIGDISSGKFEEIVQGFSRISPTAKDAGLSMEETAAIIASLVDIFGSGEIAATALKSGLLSLLNPSNEAQAALTTLGVASQDSNGELRSSKDLLVDLAGKWNTLTDAQKQQTAAILFGKDQAGAMSAVLGDWAKVQGYVTQLVDETTGAVGSMAREVEGKLKLISASVDQNNESWRQFLENLGAKITDGDQLQGLIGNLGAVGVAFKDVVNQGGFDPLIDLLKSQAGSLSAVAESIAANLPEAFKGLKFDGLIDSLEDLGGTVGDLFKSFFGEIDLTTVDGLTKALQTVMNTFEALTITVTAIIAELKPMFAAVGEVVRGFNDLDKASQVEFGSFLGQMKLIVDAGTGVGLALIAIGKAGLDMKDAMDVAFGTVTIAVNSLQTGLSVIALGLTKIWETALEGSLALYELNPFADDAVIADTKAKIADVQKFADSLAAGIEKNSEELRAGAERAGEGLLNMATSSETVRAKLDENEKSIRGAGQAAKEASGDFGQLSDAIHEVVKDADNTLRNMKFDVQLGDFDIGNPFEQAMEGVDAFQKAADGLDFGNSNFASDVDKVSTSLVKAKAATIEWSDSIKKIPPVELPKGLEKVEGVFKSGGKEAGLYATAIDGVSTSYSQIGKGTVKATGAFAAVADTTQDAKDQLNALTQSGKLTVDQLMELTKTANDFEVKMEEIASNERIKTIEASISLQTAGLEANMERVKATFASIDTTISSTGDLLGGLFGNLTGTTDRLKELEIESQIDLENKRRQEALDMQKKLAEAEIERIEAQTAALNRGDALIQIDGTGLEPELEAFMWKILGAIRTRANAEFADYLLGMGV